MNKQMFSSAFPRGGAFLATVLTAVLSAGCGGDSNAVRVRLQSQFLPDEPPTLIGIDAQVAGPTDGLTYKWFAISGECLPQESDQPRTIFRFADGVRQDEVSVEVWRSQKRVAQGELKVKYTEKSNRQQQHSPEVKIEITTIPPSELGGPNTSSHIAGTIVGKIPSDCVVAIYAKAYGAWYIQPESGSKLSINADQTWGSWTHTGTRYAALLVKKDFEPLGKMDMMPVTNNYIIAIDVVDGLPAADTNAASETASPAQ